MRPRLAIEYKAVSRHALSLVLAGLAALLLQHAEPASTAAFRQDILKEPPVFASSGGILDVLIVARPSTTTILDPLRYNAPVGWVYEICRRPSLTATSCPPGPSTSAAYGGTRLALKPGDRLKIRLVNRLPKFENPDAAKHTAENPSLIFNPTNLHTHGLIVEPRYPSVSRPTWGDNIFVVGYNPQQPNPYVPPPPFPATAQHHHVEETLLPIEYEIDIPKNHPSGLYWFHPHVHGIALNQLSAGLSGIITIGDPQDYACEDGACGTRWSSANVRHLILKDTQIEHDGSMLTQQDPQFCPEFAADGEGPRQGGCAGQFADPADGTTNHIGGRWFFTINGQVYPTIPVAQQTGEIWRLTNASGSASYELHLELQTPNGNRDLPFQVVAVDGVSLTPSNVAQLGQAQAAGSTKLHVVACGSAPTLASDPSAAAGVCASSIRMMPSSRVEVRVAYRDADGRVSVPPLGAKAVFKTVGFDTNGDQWPAIDLAEVPFSLAKFTPGKPGFATVRGQSAAVTAAGGIFAAASPQSGPAALNNNCKTPLPAGHRRRIYYGVPYLPNSTTDLVPDGFGLGYEEVDATGTPVPNTFVSVSTFDPETSIVCLPLGPGNTPVKETWELVNVSGEDHNFHIHQTKFRIVEAPVSPPSASTLVSAAEAAPANPLPFPPGTILHDNTPLPTAGDDCDGTVEAWKAGSCPAKKVVVEIAFSQLGDFVYHCHILEHEDGGMMHKISVVSR